MDIQPNPSRLNAVKNSQAIFVNGIGEVHYCEYGMGAELVNKDGQVLVDFPNHLDAERFLAAQRTQL